MDMFEFDLDESIRPSVERMVTGTTKIDSKISALPISSLPLRIGFAVALLRAYRRLAPRSIRRRCVFDPSCSHYSELAFRQHGFLRGLKLTFRRLAKCRNGAGGIDFSFLKQGD